MALFLTNMTSNINVMLIKLGYLVLTQLSQEENKFLYIMKFPWMMYNSLH